MSIIAKIVDWFDERTGLKQRIIDVAAHPVPPNAKWRYVFGTAILTSFIVQIVTGIALATIFVPSANDAFESLKYITNEAPFGKLLRGMHFFAASAMIVLVFIHMIRVYLTASYKFPRELNWLTGVVLLFLTLAMGFTGQVLRWDQDAVWTIAVGAQQALRMPLIGKFLVQVFLSGGEIGSASLGHFFALHVFVFPAVLIGMIGLHVYLVLYNGISEPPVLGEPVDPKTYKQKYEEMLKRIGRPFWPDAAWRDIVFSVLVVIIIMALAAYFGAPQLKTPPDQSLVKAQPHPDWYLLWYFALLALLPHEAENWIIILFPLALIVLLLAVPFVSNRGERSLKRRPWALGVVIFSLASFAALTTIGVQEPWTPKFEAEPLSKEIIGASSGAIYDGAQVFNNRGCLFCHTISGHGGKHGPELSDVGDRLTHDQIVVRIVNGGYNMPAYAGNIKPQELADLTAFLQSRKIR